MNVCTQNLALYIHFANKTIFCEHAYKYSVHVHLWLTTVYDSVHIYAF